MEETAAPSIDSAPLPATAPPSQRWQLLAYAALIAAAWFAMSLWGLGKVPFHTKGEPREGLVVWEMTHGGGWVLPMRNGEEVPSKPPLFHWLGALTSIARGAADEWSIRFPSAALSLLSLWCVLLAGATLWEARAGLLSALALMTMFEWARSATAGRVDMTLTFGLQAAFLCLLFFLRTRSARWLTPLYLSIAVAVLGKGFVGALLPGLVALAMILLSRDWRLLAEMRLPRGAAIVAAGAGLWYVLALFVGGSSFFYKQILGEQLFTFVNNPDFGWKGHRHSLAYLPGALLLGLLPWTPFFAGVVSSLWRQRKTLTLKDARVFLLVWIAVVFVFYQLAAQKRSVYLLALYPAAALLLGSWWHEQLSQPDRQARLATTAQWLGRLLLAVLVPLSVLLFLQSLGAPLLEWMTPMLSRSARLVLPAIAQAVRDDRAVLGGLLLASMAALVVVTRGGRGRDWRMIFAGLALATVALQLTVRIVFLPAVAQRQTFREFMREVRSRVGAQADLRFYKTFEYGAVFYYEGHIPQYKGPWPIDAPRFLLMTASEWEQHPETAAVYEKVDLANTLHDKIKDPLLLVRRRDDARRAPQ